MQFSGSSNVTRVLEVRVAVINASNLKVPSDIR